MPTALVFSLLGLVCAVTMASYHGFYLISRHVLPEPAQRVRHGARAVCFELVLTLAVLGPLLRRVLPENTWTSDGRAPIAAVLTALIFAWLPFAKLAVLLAVRSGPRKDRLMATLYSAPLSLLYVAGIGYILVVTILMMLAR
jgi:hypothetical protein